MTKIANKPPETSSRPVYVTEDQYEIWYSKPVSLGLIDKRGDYWYTADGMRFASSRNAMAYLVKLYDLGHKVDPYEPQPSSEVAATKKAVAKEAAKLGRSDKGSKQQPGKGKRNRLQELKDGTTPDATVGAGQIPLPEDILAGDTELVRTLLSVVRKHRESKAKKEPRH